MRKFFKRIFKIFFFLAICFVVFIESLIFNAQKNNIDINEKYVFVLGAKVENSGVSDTLKERLDMAVNYLEKHKNAKAILCGGKEDEQSIPQAVAMKDYLVKNGISKERILLESKSKNTFENIKFGLDLIEKKPSSVMVISSNYHIFRAKLIFYRFGILAHSIPAKTPKKDFLYSNVREFFAVIKTYLFDRPTKADIESLHQK